AKELAPRLDPGGPLRVADTQSYAEQHHAENEQDGAVHGQALLSWAGAPANVWKERSLSQVALSLTLGTSRHIRPSSTLRIPWRMRMLIGHRSAHAGPPSRQQHRSHVVKLSFTGSYEMRDI